MIITVNGEIKEKKEGIILPHEHLISDLRPLVDPLDIPEFREPLSLSNYGLVSRNPYAVLENALLPGIDVMTDEVSRFKKNGGGMIVDVTTSDFGRNPQMLKEISEKTDVDIVMGCGYYIDCSVAEENKNKTVNQIADEIIKEITEGIDGIRAGVIGEVGSSMETTGFEYKSLEAAAIAQKETGAGMHIHACLWNREGLNALDYAIKCGANPGKICVDHADVLLDAGYIEGILERGAYVDFDDFGKEFYVDRKYRNLLLGSFASDKERVIKIKELIDKGYLKQIFVTTDICLRSMLHAFGGWGYDHIPNHIVPMMEDFGITAEEIKTITEENPLRFLEM